jgi:hypothetical protein
MPRRPAGTPSQPETQPHTTAIEIKDTVIRALRPEAARRDLSVNRLVRSLLDIIASDKLTTAVLGDD